MAIRGPSDALTVEILERALIDDPNRAVFWQALAGHRIARHDYEKADEAMIALYHLAPKSAFMKDMLARRRDP